MAPGNLLIRTGGFASIDARVMSVEMIYRRLAPIYDWIYGATLQPGRRRAFSRLTPQPGERILEVGIGTGFGSALYPADCFVVGIDVSAAMLARARQRVAATSVRLCRMDATHLGFGDGRFDAVYAPYILNVVDDPVAVARELRRVCRPGGRLVLLNHFDHGPGRHTFLDRMAGCFASRLTEVDWHLSLEYFLRRANLTPSLVERVNVAQVTTLIVCHRER